jgi:hypothetical protein
MAPEPHEQRHHRAKVAEYSFKTWRMGSAWGKTVDVRLEAADIVVQFPGKPEERIPLSTIRRVRLQRPVTRSRRFSFALKLEDGRQFWLESPACNGFAVPGYSRWSDPTHSYAPFVKALHRELLAHRSQIEFRAAGIGGRFDPLGLIGALVFVGFLLQPRTAGGFDPQLMVFIALMLGLGALASSLWPSKYEPDAIPDGFLPG